MLGVIMLSVTRKPFMLSVVILNVVMLSVVTSDPTMSPLNFNAVHCYKKFLHH